jgi:cobaltochelatase CobS
MSTDKITCAICGAQIHSVQLHLKKDHPEMTTEQYVAKFPEAPLMSEFAQTKLAEKRAEKRAAAAAPAEASGLKFEMATSATVAPKDSIIKKAFHEVFGLGKVKSAMSAKGEAIPIGVLVNSSCQDFVPDISDNYVFDIDELKNVILAQELNIPCYVWGHKGAGKSELHEQVAARTGRPYVRVQHTVNTEESHIVGQWTVKDGHTVFEYGQLPLAMINGWTYCADEYDFMLPSVSSVYQAVLEGKPLVIKEAPVTMRIIKPHPNFRFVATGNTNGSGDETGLYQGTVIGNSANYDRFGMVVNKQYMNKKAESQILQNHVGLVKEDADKMVEFAGLVRDAYDGAKVSDVISPRTLIYAAKIGVKRGSFRQGLTLSFINKLSRVDREVIDGLAQRIFG